MRGPPVLRLTGNKDDTYVESRTTGQRAVTGSRLHTGSLVAFRRAGLAGFFGVAFVLAGASVPQVPPPALRPTAHPTLPASPDDLWLAPTPDQQASAAVDYAGLQEGVRRSIEGDDREALPLVADPAWAKTPLADYARFYAGRTRLGLGRYAEAQQDFLALVDERPIGYLSEGATLGAAEAAEGLDQPEVALRLYQTLAGRKPAAPEQVWLKIGQMAEAIDDRPRAVEALLRVYYECPLSDEAAQAVTDLRALGRVAGAPGTRAAYPRDLARADVLYRAGRVADARAAYLDLRTLASGDERTMIDVRLASCELGLKRYRTARDRVRRAAERKSPFEAEARFLYARATGALGRQKEFVTRMRSLMRDFPGSPWSAAALDALATHYVVVDQDADAAEAFAQLYANDPKGRYAERAAWKAGWWAWRHRDYAGTTRFFEGAAAGFPRSNYRPSYLYWAGRARAQMGDTARARDRFQIAVTDYGNSDYGRLAATALAALPPAPPKTGSSDLARPTDVRPPAAAPPPTAALVRRLVAAGLYDAALAEIDYAARQWGPSAVLDASRALVLYRQGDYRHAIPFIKRAYPQYLTADGVRLPDEIQKVIFPLDYWPLIQKYAAAEHLDPYLVAALVGQESAFDASARSAANAYGLMQLVPATGRLIGRSIGMRRVTTRSLLDPDTNLRLGTAHFADLIEEFGALHLALAAYNAGDQRVRAWVKERPGLPVEEFIDDIPYPETQSYVRRILGIVVDYRRLYGGGQG